MITKAEAVRQLVRKIECADEQMNKAPRQYQRMAGYIQHEAFAEALKLVQQIKVK